LKFLSAVSNNGINMGEGATGGAFIGLLAIARGQQQTVTR
jgi:hypothetical protein